MSHSGSRNFDTLWHLSAFMAFFVVLLSVINFFPRFCNGRNINQAISPISKYRRITYRQKEPSGCQKILWFTGFAPSAVSNASDLLKVALLSAKKRAPSLVPVLIYSGPNEHPLPQWFENRGGFVVHHNSSLIPFFEELPENRSSHFILRQGVYLRYEIPAVVNK